MIRAWVWESGTLRTIEAGEAVQRAAAGAGTIWIDVDGEERASLETLLKPLQVHPVAIDDLVMEANRPKVDNYGAYIYLVIHSARWGADDRPTLREIDILVGDRFLLTYHEGETRSILEAQGVVQRRPELLARGPAHLLHFILDVLVDHYLPIMDQISDEIDVLEKRCFHPDRHLHARILRLKRGMAALRRIVGPQRDTILALTRDEFHPIPADMRPYLRNVYDRLARVNDLLDSFRDEVAGLLDLHVSVISNRLNQTIKVLTVLATLGLPLTLITSYYGMNFRMAAYGWEHGELFVLGLLGGSLLVTWLWMRRHRWL